MRRGFFQGKGGVPSSKAPRACGVPFPELFAHISLEDLKARAGFIRKEIAEEALCLPASPVVVRVRISGRGFRSVFCSTPWAIYRARANPRFGLYPLAFLAP